MKQKTLKLKFHRSYKNGAGKQIFVYFVSGSSDSLDSYKDYQGDMLRYEDNDEDKRPLYFTQRFAYNEAILCESQSENGGWYVDRTEEDKVQSMLDQYGDTPLGRAMAAEVAREKLAMLRKGNTPSASKASAPADKAPADDSLGEL